IASLEAAGAVRQPWAAFLAATGMGEVELEAREALAQVAGPKAARILCRQLAGCLRAEFDRIESLTRAGDRAAARAMIERLQRASRVGLRLTRPWRVVLAGPVNSGKSSLVNALAGYARSIVSAEPGTTRDVLETRIVLGGWEIDLIDTAGLRLPENCGDASPTERAGIDRAIAAAAKADLVLEIHDSRFEKPRSQERDPGVKTLCVLSKADLSPSAKPAPPDGIRTSAITGEGIDTLATSIVRSLVPEEADDPSLLAGAVPFTERQAMLLDALRAGLQ
ncbi:MAG: GTPase, partial [Planctomycetia bacterium]